MRLAITGGTGLVGRFLVQEALAAGDDVTLLSRRAPEPGFFAGPVAHLLYSLTAPAPMLHEFDALIHCSFDHIPGRYRGGEGDDPEGFRRANLEGSLTLIRAAEAAGVTRFVFLSSRAVYGRQPPGARLQEDTPCHPNTLYGEVKLAIEQALAASALQ
ncbi:MAG: NAD-dependent epimerase/dehydratase family protein, partial [Mangrovicoccus sp.]